MFRSERSPRGAEVYDRVEERRGRRSQTSLEEERGNETGERIIRLLYTEV